MKPIYYCSYCGKVQNLSDDENAKCHSCKKPLELFEALNDKSYYQNRSKEIYGNPNKWHDVLMNEEIINNPNFDSEAVNYQWNEIDEEILDNESSKQYDSRYIPKCPLCSSPDIQEISIGKRIIHAIFFGLFSKTARSQWECLNCDNKF